MGADRFAERRERFLAAVGEGVAVIPAGAEVVRNSDVNYEFRQDSDFFFLTGFEEPEAVAVFNPTHPSERYVLFVRPRDREKEIWEGHRAGVEGAREAYLADAAYPLAELSDKLGEYLVGPEVLYYRAGDTRHDGMVLGTMQRLRGLSERYGRTVPRQLWDPSPLLHELRLRKSPAEIAELRRACAISVEAHTEAMRFAHAGLHEYQVQAALEYVFRLHGSPRNGYPSIVASGPNACVLHYTRNDRELAAGDLLLIDAGAEYGYFSADITRTFPVDGTFSGPQRAVYEVVLAAQRAALAECAPGRRLRQVHDAATRMLTEGLVELGLLPRGAEDSLAMHHYREFFMHGTSHWLGMDVHDAGGYRPGGESRVLEEGMAFTVEPGLYVGPGRDKVTFHLLEYDIDEWGERRLRLGMEEARKLEAAEQEEAEKVEHPLPPQFLGIGVRVEDDVLITAGGRDNLTTTTPTTIEEVEAACAEPPRLPVW